jgi:hypothetical protein
VISHDSGVQVKRLNAIFSSTGATRLHMLEDTHLSVFIGEIRTHEHASDPLSVFPRGKSVRLNMNTVHDHAPYYCEMPQKRSWA